MYDAPGIGLAAIQIGERSASSRWTSPRRTSRRAAGVHQPGDDLGVRREDRHEEGCLSIPEYLRGGRAAGGGRVRYLDLDGKQQEIEAEGLLATCLQHEIDHLNGVLFIDHISKLKRDRVIKKFTKAAKLGKARRSRSGGGSKCRSASIFMGTPEFAVPTLLEIVGRGHEVAAVYTRAPKPAAGRGMG